MRPTTIAAVETTLAHEWMFVRIHADNGVEGVGQTGFWGWPDAAERIVDSFRSLLVGRNPMDVGRLWMEMYRNAPFRGGALTGAIAAIDIALWDLAGRLLDVPAYQLLGGAHRDRVRLHALFGSGWLSDRTSSDTDSVPDSDTYSELVVRQAMRAVELGFTAVKFDPVPEGPDGFHRHSWSRVLTELVGCVGDVRDAVGWGVDILVELHRKFSPGEAVAVAAELEPLRVYFIEDALPPDSVDSWGELAAKVRVPLAAGERTDTIWEFKEYLVRGAAQFVRPDVGLAGGLSHCLKIAALAEAHHARVVAHNFLGPLLTAATLQLYAAIPNVGTFEYALMDEEDERRLALLKTPLRRDDGYLAIPDGPGLGVELSDNLDSLPEFHRLRPQLPLQTPEGSIYTR